jgi:hypothetical protein
MSTFKKIIERSAQDSRRQEDIRLRAYADTTFNERGTNIKAGDVINMPYPSGTVSTIEALGEAWITASGVF